jgi:hypothetical protein
MVDDAEILKLLREIRDLLTAEDGPRRDKTRQLRARTSCSASSTTEAEQSAADA